MKANKPALSRPWREPFRMAPVGKYIRKYFGKRGEHVVQENLKCVREGLKSVMEVPWNIISAPAQPKAKAEEEVVFAK